MLQVGFGRLEITPPLGCPLDGYFRDRYAKGVLDALEVNAIAFSDGENRAVMIAADLLGVDMADVKVIKRLITERLGLAEDHVFISALHQHTSLFLKHQQRRNLPETYADVLYRKFADVAKLALDDLADATMYSGAREVAEPIAFVRRYHMPGGKVATNPKKELGTPLGPCDEADNTARFLRFAREGKADVVLINFSTHPDVIGGEYYSADWPGFARRMVEREVPNTRCLFFTGTEGDSNHVNYMKPSEERFPCGKGYPHSRFMGRQVADAVIAALPDAIPHADGKLHAAITTIYNRSNTTGEEKYEECKAFYEAFQAHRLDYSPTGEELAFARRVIHIREEMSIYRHLPVSVLRIGDVVIAGFAGEPFTDYGREVRRVAGDRFAIALCLTNGYQGYLPTAKAFEEGGYEAANSHFTPTLQAQAIGAVEALLTSFEKGE